MNFHLFKINQEKKNLTCPSDNCINIPEIKYKYNPLESKIIYKCKCNNNVEKEISIKEFLDKSEYLICNDCKKIISDNYIFLFCKVCQKIFDNNCFLNHQKNKQHFNFIPIQKSNLFNLCNIHYEHFDLICMNCNECFCNECNIDFHKINNHLLKKIKDVSINKEYFDNKISIFEKQKNIFKQIKNTMINNDSIKLLEYDIEIKQRIINSYNKNNYYSIINFKELYIKNNEKYENIIVNILNHNIENDSDETRINNFIDKNLLLIYYSLMINEDELLNNNIINTIEKKFTSLNENNINIKNNDNENKNNLLETKIENNINIENPQTNFNNNKEKIIIIKNKIILDDEDDDYNPDNSKEISEKIKSKNNKDFKLYEEEKGKKKDLLGKQDNMFISNMIKLRSGNFAISNKNTVEIYDFRKLNYDNGINIFNNKLIEESRCLIKKYIQKMKINLKI